MNNAISGSRRNLRKLFDNFHLVPLKRNYTKNLWWKRLNSQENAKILKPQEKREKENKSLLFWMWVNFHKTFSSNKSIGEKRRKIGIYCFSSLFSLWFFSIVFFLVLFHIVSVYDLWSVENAKSLAWLKQKFISKFNISWRF